MKKAASKEKRAPMPDSTPASDEYRVVSSEAGAEIRILSSRFIGLVRPCGQEEAFDEWLRSVRAKYHDATHHCSAWRIGREETRSRSSDDGEPSGSAGRRILGVLESNGVTNTGLIVVRYFGGTKLGVSGLGRAYQEAAAATLANARIETRAILHILEITFPVEQLRVVHHIIGQFDGKITERRFETENIYRVELRRSRALAVEEEIASRCHGRARVRFAGEV